MPIDIPFGSIISFSLVLFLTPILRRLLIKYQILENKNKRSIHKTSVPSFGGIVFFISFLLGVLFDSSLDELSTLRELIISFGLIALIGLRDDIIPISAWYKLLGQSIPAALIVIHLDMNINHFGGFLGINEIPEPLNMLLSFIFILFLTNSFNLIDGIDGLAASISLLTITTFVVIIPPDSSLLIQKSLFLIAALLGFLFYNWQPAKIFMGDTGALFLGFYNSILAIEFFNSPIETITLSNPITFTIAIFSIPILDTARTFISRLLRGVSPFEPDKTHIHHFLIRLGLSHAKSVIALLFINIVFILLALYLSPFSDNVGIPMIILLGIIISYTTDLLIAKKFSKKALIKQIKANKEQNR
jgi:UDP-N-acetylmuramyl pentapeptide phosphotransferase/UDP-N-acetylglucosamine-1-phosphate transferase